MTIDRITNNQYVQGAYVRGADAAASSASTDPVSGAPPVQAAAGVDEVSLSDTARSLATARAAVNNAPDVREGRVAAVRAQIQSGTYKVSPEAIAQKMLAQGPLDADGDGK